MSPLYVDEILDAMHQARGSEWDGFATGMDATRLYHYLLPLRRDLPFPLIFDSPRAYYSTDFFAVLLPLMSEDMDHEWMASMLEQSDLDQDPILLARIQEAMVRD